MKKVCVLHGGIRCLQNIFVSRQLGNELEFGS